MIYFQKWRVVIFASQVFDSLTTSILPNSCRIKKEHPNKMHLVHNDVMVLGVT